MWALGRTVYLLDVRSESEYREGHLAGSAHAPAGQLIQSLDAWCATRGARILLIDAAPHARAVMAAHWLKRLGWDVAVVGGLRVRISPAQGRSGGLRWAVLPARFR